MRAADVGFIPLNLARYRDKVDAIHPLKLYQYLASGLPVVGAATGAVGERLTDAPWGRTFTPGDPDSLAEATQDVLSRDRDAIGRAARQWAEDFSWDRTFSRLLEVYRTVLE